MQFRFIGDPDNKYEGPEVSTHYGYRFVKGEPCEVDAETAKKLATNDHFKHVKNTRVSLRLHEPDLDAMTKDQLEAYARSRYGLELDKRYSLENLIRQVREHGNQDRYPQQGA